MSRQHHQSDLDMTTDTTGHTLELESDAVCPEGGLRAWLVVLGAWCAMIPSMGMLNTVGVIDAWIGENQLSSLPKSQTAWVVSIYAFLLYVGGSFAGECEFCYHNRRLDVLKLTICLKARSLTGMAFDR